MDRVHLREFRPATLETHCRHGRLEQGREANIGKANDKGSKGHHE